MAHDPGSTRRSRRGRRTGLAAALGCLLGLHSLAASADLAGWWNVQTPESTPGLQLGLSGSVAIGVGLENHIRITNFRAQQNRNAAPDPDVDPGVGLHARAGYRLHPRIVVEGQFEWVSEWTIDGRDSERTNPNSASDTARAEAWTATANLKLYPFTLGRVQPWLAGGIGLMRFQGDNRSPRVPANDREILQYNIDGLTRTDFAGRVGGGLDIYFTDHWSLVLGASYVIPAGQLDPFDYVSTEWGLQYRF